MVATPEMWTTAKKRWIVGWIALLLTSLIVAVMISLERKLNGSLGWGEIISFGIFLGVLSVLIYSYRGWKSFGECMHVSVMPIAALYIVLGLLFLVCMLVALVLKGVSFMFLTLLVFLVYFGGAFYLALAAVMLTALSCAGGSFVFGTLWIMRRIAEAGSA